MASLTIKDGTPLNDKMSCVMRKPTMWFLNRSDTNGAVYTSTEESGNLIFKKKRNCTICVAKTKPLISCAVSCAVTAQLICAFVFAY